MRLCGGRWSSQTRPYDPGDSGQREHRSAHQHALAVEGDGVRRPLLLQHLAEHLVGEVRGPAVHNVGNHDDLDRDLWPGRVRDRLNERK